MRKYLHTKSRVDDTVLHVALRARNNDWALWARLSASGCGGPGCGRTAERSQYIVIVVVWAGRRRCPEWAG